MGIMLYNVYEEYEDDDFYRFFNGFDAETSDIPYGPELDASIWFRTNDYSDAAGLFFRCFEHYKSQRRSDKERKSLSYDLMEDWPEKYLEKFVDDFEEEWKSFVESLGTKNYKTSAKLKKFAKDFESKYKRDKDGQWGRNLEKLMKPFFQMLPPVKKKTSPAKKRVRQVTKPKTKKK